MKKIAALSLIFSCLFGVASASYQQSLDRIWDQTVVKVDANYVSSIESSELPIKLKKASNEMRSKESLLLNFYPKGSGFDTLTGEQFLDLKEFEELADQMGFDIELSYPQHHVAQFEDQYDLQDFVKRQFDREVVLSHYPLTFPTKIVTAKLVKR